MTKCQVEDIIGQYFNYNVQERMLPAWQVHVIEQCFNESKFAFFSEVKRHLPANYIATNDCVIYNFWIYVDRLHISLHEYRTTLKICRAL